MEGVYKIAVNPRYEELKDAWLSLEACNKRLSPFQSFEYNSIVAKHFWVYQLKGISTPYYLVVSKDDKPLMIAPLRKCCNRGNFEFRFLGENQTGILDFIYPENISENDFQESIRLIKTKIHFPIKLVRLNEQSKIFKYYPKLERVNQDTSVTVHIPEDYQEYFSSLSKQARQNIRTAYNRLEKDGVKYELRCYSSREIGKDVYDEIMSLYLDRLSDRYGKNNHFANRFFYRHFQHYTTTLREMSSSVFFVLTMNGLIAAFMGGFLNQVKDCYLVPRLAINSEFQRYSPGILLSLETIKYFITSTNIREMDLSRGAEKYKYILGGVNHYSYDIVL